MHREVRLFCEDITRRFPQYFFGNDVLDCGSLDINGNNRYLFTEGTYLGIDICEGKNVDVVTPVHLFQPEKSFDVVISTEMLEHDCNWKESIQNMFFMTRFGGLLLFTAAGTNRPEHGTTSEHPKDSPLTHDYYCNITAAMIIEALELDSFLLYQISYSLTDIRFVGIKR